MAAQRVINYDAAPKSEDAAEMWDEYAEGYCLPGEGLEYR